MVRIAIFLTILLAALAYALRKGGAPERTMALILIAMAAADQLLHLFIPPRFTSIDAGHLAIDLVAAAASVILALVAHRFWPMLAAVLQILPLMAHVGKAADITVHPVAYLTMQVSASWLLPPLLVIATWRHQTRMCANGSDRSWHGLSRQSHPKTASS